MNINAEPDQQTVLLSSLTSALREQPEAALKLVLPDGSEVPGNFHVTEVGRVRKRFIDCGGTMRDAEQCVLQVWVAENDENHRLTAGKLEKIIGLAGDILGGEDFAMEIEVDVGVITQMPIARLDVAQERITMHLAGKHTACLAPDRCGVDEPKPATGCCSPNPIVTLGGGSSGCC